MSLYLFTELISLSNVSSIFFIEYGGNDGSKNREKSHTDDKKTFVNKKFFKMAQYATCHWNRQFHLVKILTINIFCKEKRIALPS